MKLHERVSEVIRRDGRTQVEICQAAGVSQATLSSILTGARTDLRAEVVARVGRACGLSPTALGRLLYDAFPAPDTSGK